MLKHLIKFIKRRFGKKQTTRRPLFDAQDPRRLARQRRNKIYHKTLKKIQQIKD